MGAIGGEELMRWEKMEGVDEGEEKILVSVRLRPLNAKEIARNDPSDWECINDTTIIFRNSLRERSMLPAAYTFDRVFRCESTTKEVYEEGAKEVALSVVSGINSTIFAYGQTSSGKTYTINGITEYTVADIYDYIKRHDERAFALKFSAMEIYNEAVKDLLSTESTPLRLLDDPEKGTVVEKLTEETLRDWNHLKGLLSMCEAQRQIGETLLNETSSRSHQILRLTVESSAREFLGKDNSSTLVASVNFVDLAGSERASLTLSSGARLKEGCHINRSLLTLGTVIRKLSKGRNGHIPYRDSKLTRILQPSLGGNARTAIICTVCPARSHIEQSRNTLLFASCAKEVVTSARVNVVMSDKALVKHLQKEVARLESELKYPGSASSTHHFEALLREKDDQIKKMDKEIRELMQERDVALSCLEDFRHYKETSQVSLSGAPNAYSDMLPTSKSSGVAYHGLDFGSSNFQTSVGGSNHIEHYLRHREKQTEQNVPSLSHSFDSSMHQSEEIAHDTSEDYDDLCKEVRCIELGETVRNEDSELHQPEISTMHADREAGPDDQMDMRHHSSSSTLITLEQHLQNVRKTIDSLVKPLPNGSAPWSSIRDFSNSKGLTITRSRSCRAKMMNNPSPWLQEEGQNESTPPSSSIKDFPGRPDVFRRRLFTSNYGSEETPSGGGSESSQQSLLTKLHKAEDGRTVSRGCMTSISDFVAELKELAQVQYKKHLADGQELDQNTGEHFGADGKDAGLDSMPTPTVSPSRWPREFEKKQQEIIELWHSCNVSLVHRTYFFLLFKGDPSDSIYMEVELRRLSFLKRSFSRRHLDKTISLGSGQNTTMIESLKNLRRERGMLCRKMWKKMTAEERESIYAKWGIVIGSKQRRMQLAGRLWSETRDIEHVRESSSIVAKLIGLTEPGKALREMFGLSFTPQQADRRSYSWRHGMPSFNSAKI